MNRTVTIVGLTIVLLGCSGSPHSVPVGFINQTRHSDADLWTMWAAAQQSVATRIDLNPVQRSTNNANANILPGDARALSIQPLELMVAAEPDVSSAILLAETGVSKTDPTGMIACPQPCSVRFASAYSLFNPMLTKYAASWELTDINFRNILQYEFENQILFALEYDMTWR